MQSFLKSLMCHMIVSNCNSSSNPIRCNHIIWKERYSRSSQGDSNFWLLTFLFIFQLQCSYESMKKLRWTHVISTCKGSWKLKHNDCFQVIFSISHGNLQTFLAFFIIFIFFVWSFSKLCEDQKKIILLQCSHFFPKKNCQILEKNKLLKCFQHIWIVILVLVAFLN